MVNILEVVQVLQREVQRKGIPLLHSVKVVNNNIMITCPYHKNGQERSPSCGILLKDRVSHDKVYKAGTVHCFTCGETHTIEEMITHVFGYGDGKACI
jgi:DNA primase